MAHVLVRHKVKDYAAWKAVFDRVTDIRRSGGEKAFQIFHPEGEANHLFALFTWDNTANARKFFAAPELQKAMQQAGVAEKPSIYYLEEVAHGTL